MTEFITGEYGSGEYGSSPYGSFRDFIVTGAAALSTNVIDVEFNDTLAVDSAATDPANYAISPPVTVLSVVIPPDSISSVRLIVEPSVTHQLYTVTVTGVRSAFDTPIDLLHNTATFVGPGPALVASGLAPTRIHLIFLDGPRLQNAALTDPTKYTVLRVDGTPIAVSSVIVEPTAASVVLVLAGPMQTTSLYVITVAPEVVSVPGLPSIPPTTTFVWIQKPLTATFRGSAFSGEASGGLFGNPLGLVFFSPAFVTSTPNSVIQVDEVDVCSKAYDSYVFPKPIDPRPLYTFGGPVQPSHLNRDSLFAPFPRLAEAKFTLDFTNVEPMPQAVDGAVSVTLQERWDHTRVSLLNNTAWNLFDNTSTSVPPMFITADNLTPIPAGGASLLILSMPMTAGADVSAGAVLALAATSALTATATVTAMET